MFWTSESDLISDETLFAIKGHSTDMKSRKPVKATLPALTLPAKPSSVHEQGEDAVHLDPGMPAQKPNIDDDSTYESAAPPLK